MRLLRGLWREIWLAVALASAVFFVASGGRATADLSDPVRTSLLFLWLFPVILLTAFSVVRHAEALARLYGEPSGTLILTLSAVCVEVIMVSSMMLIAQNNPTMARDTIYSTLMLVFNAQIGISMLLGGMRHGEQRYNLKSSNSYFSVILTLAGLSLYLPMAVPAPQWDALEIFLIFASMALYFLFLRVQTREHRYFFEPEPLPGGEDEGEGIPDRGAGAGLRHAAPLLLALAAAGYLSGTLALVLDGAVEILHLPSGWASLAVAMLILSPEGLTAVRAGMANQMQRVVNVSMGSALSTVGLTVPAVLLLSAATGREVVLGLAPDQAVMLLLTFLLGMRSYGVGETNVLQGLIHFVLFAAFVLTIVI